METLLKPPKSVKQNILVYAAFLLVAASGILYGNAIKGDFMFLRVWDYQNLVVLLTGIPFLFLQRIAGLPDFFDRTVSHKNRILIPVLIGAFFGILDILVIKVILHPEPYTELPPFLQPFPYSVFLYSSGAFEIEVFYRLIPLTLVLLLGNWLAGGKFYKIFLWLAMVLTSLREPLEQWPNAGIALVIYSLLTGFLMNFIQAYYYKKAGFIASITLRLGHYLFWHILLGIFVQYVELR